MDNSSQGLANYLQCNNIRPTYPRVKVLEFLVVQQNHPTAEDIYLHLVREIPSLSKTTVYNTLKLLVDRGLAKVVNIEENEMRYDVILTKHGHFKCESCGKIVDFPVNIEDIGTEGLDGFKIHEKDVLFRGVCPQCLGREKNGG
ncbi:MAG TPA: Fur family transcriptional regulator [Selenomonadales bacterium]|nr:Fur family transcriptional regulator [Selenomonadales bacterium]